MDLLQGKQKEKGRNKKRTSETFCRAEWWVNFPLCKTQDKTHSLLCHPPETKGKEIKERPKCLDRTLRGFLAWRMGMRWTVRTNGPLKEKHPVLDENTMLTGLEVRAAESHQGSKGVNQVPELKPAPHRQREREKAALNSWRHEENIWKTKLQRILFCKENGFNIFNNTSERL